MLTLERGRGWSVYSLGGRRGTWASALHCAQTGGAGCPGLREWPDVRADLVQLRVSSVMGAGFPGVGPDIRAGAGCPGPVADGSSSFSFLQSRAHLALVLGLSMVYSGVPKYPQGSRLK